MKISICKACQNANRGVKTRLAVPHTCIEHRDEMTFNRYAVLWNSIEQKPEPNRFCLFVVEIKQAIFGEHSDDIVHWDEYLDVTRGIMNEDGKFEESNVNSWTNCFGLDVDEYARKTKVTYWYYMDDFVKFTPG